MFFDACRLKRAVWAVALAVVSAWTSAACDADAPKIARVASAELADRPGEHALRPAFASAAGNCSVADLVERVRPSVVGITTQREVSGGLGGLSPFFGVPFGHGQSGTRVERGLGSGFIIDAAGLIVTNHHVIDGADELSVRLADGTVLSARLKGDDAPTDLALIALDEPPQGLKAVEFGDSDALRVGDCAVAIGDPFGLELTVTRGLISAKGREITDQPYDQFLQTDAAINPGNSGGPLFDLDGRVIGINTAIVASAQGIGFAVPVNMLKALIPELKTRGRVVRGYLGIASQTLTPDLAAALQTDAEKGALVAQVERASPAQKAGLRTGDLIVAVQGEPIDGASALSRAIAARAPGTKVEIAFWRGGRQRRVEVELGERPGTWDGQTPDARGERSSRLGVQLREVPEEMAQELGIKGGALIVRVETGSRAAKAGLRPGDVVVGVGQEEIDSPSALSSAVQKQGDKAFVLRLFRHGQPAFVAVPAADKDERR